MSEPPVLELIGVRASYGRIEVLHGVDLVVPARSVVALLGPNGAGKTTTLRVACGQHRPTQGCVHVAGKHVNGADPDALSRAGVCTIPEGRGIFANLSVEENLQMMTYGGASFSQVKERAFDRFPRLHERRDAACRNDVRRRAADARDGARAGDRARAAASRRDLDGPRAADRCRALRAREAHRRRRRRDPAHRAVRANCARGSRLRGDHDAGQGTSRSASPPTSPKSFPALIWEERSEQRAGPIRIGVVLLLWVPVVVLGTKFAIGLNVRRLRRLRHGDESDGRPARVRLAEPRSAGQADGRAELCVQRGNLQVRAVGLRPGQHPVAGTGCRGAPAFLASESSKKSRCAGHPT